MIQNTMASLKCQVVGCDYQTDKDIDTAEPQPHINLLDLHVKMVHELNDTKIKSQTQTVQQNDGESKAIQLIESSVRDINVNYFASIKNL